MNSFALVDHLGWVLIHSLWQFGAIALLAGLVVWMLRQSSSSARYGVWVIALAVSVAAPVVTWMVLPIEMPAVIAVDPPAGDEVVIRVPIEPIVAAPPMSQDITIAGDLPPASLEPRDPSLIAAAPSIEVTPSASWSEWLTALLRPWMAWIVSTWCVGVGLCALRPLLGWHTLWRLRTVGVAPVSEDIRVALRRVSDRLGLRQTVLVWQSTLAQVPVVVGYLRPVILLPVSLLANMPPSQLEAVLAHELAHIRRHDFVVNLLQTLVETLFFYHPAVWWLSRQIRIEREHCCDDLVVAALGNRVEYGRALLAIEELRGERTLLALGAHDGSLLSRIRRIVGFRADRTASSPWLGILVVTGLFGVIVSIGVSGWTASTETEPDTAIETVDDDESDIEKTLEPPKPAIAEWADGRSIEFVGITKNTAPANDGWLPNGLPIGDVGYWKSTTVLHGGNTMATYVENGPHPEPDAEAIDFLFRFRGLKAQPSLRFDLPAHGTGYSHWPVTDPYELRVSTRKRGPQPPGGQWVPPDGVVRVGVTDEPWGRWVKVSPEGKVLDPIQPEERHASTYKLIEVVGTKRHERISTGVAILFRQPTGNKDPDNPDHQYAWEYRAIDNEGKEHWALQWESSNNESQYGLAKPLPAGKTLSHYEYRVRPYRHWATFANVSLQPGPQTEVKITAQTAATTPAEKLANHFAAALRAQKLPFLDDAKIAHLRGELLDLLQQRAPSSINEEQFRKLQDEYRQHAAELAGSQNVLRSIRYFFAGLKLPETTPARWKVLTEGVTQFVRREFDPSEKDYVYLEFRDRMETLKLFLAAALVTPEWTPTQIQQQEAQRGWMKAEIVKLPESAKFRLTHQAELARLQALFDDPLNYFFNRPLSDVEFAKVKTSFAAIMTLDRSETRLVAAVNRMAMAMIDDRSGPLRDAWPLRSVGAKRNGTRWSTTVVSPTGRHSINLDDLHRGSDPPRQEAPRINLPPRSEPVDPLARSEWIDQSFKMDVPSVLKANAFVAMRGGEIAVLNVTNWSDADRVPMAELRQLIEREGVDKVPLSTFIEPRSKTEGNDFKVRADAPSLVAQTKEGRLYVARLFPDRPAVQIHLRPLLPDPPMHLGDPTEIRVLNALGKPATFNSITTAQVGFPQKPMPKWVGWPNKHGVVPLGGLPFGTHWIVAAAEFEQRTIFPLTYPTGEREIERRLRNSEPWTEKDLEFKTRFEPNEKTGGEIVVTIQNKFDKPLTVSEADFSLHVGQTAMYRTMSPQWVDGKFQTVEIPAKESGEIRLSWNEWVRNGFWVSRDGETISEPALPPDEPGRIYVRVNLGNSGALPIAVTAPAVILENPKPESSDERTSLLESLIKDPKLETFQKLLALAEGEHPTPMELLDDSRSHSGKEKMGGEVKVVSNGKERFAIVSANVLPIIIIPAEVATRVDPDRRAECAFVFDMQGRLIDTLGGKLAGSNSLGGDDIHVVNLGPEEDWFVRVMNFEKRGELNYRSDYYRIANPVVKSFRFYNLPNACSWSNGPEKIPRQGRLHPAHPQAQRPSFAGIPKQFPVTTAAGVPTVGSIVWDGDRNRWYAAPSAFVKGLPLYEVDTTWSQEFEPLEPQAGQLVIEGGLREFDHWYAWEAAVPDQGHAVGVLTIPRREGPEKVLVELAPGRHTIQLQAKPDEKGPGVKLKLWIDDDQKYDFDMPFVFGEAFANHPPIVHTLKPTESARLVHRLLKETTAALLFEIKLQPQDLAATVTAISEKDPTPEAERQARAILRDRFHIRVDRTPGSDAAGSLHLFNLPAAAWEFVGQLTGIRQIRVEAGDARGEAIKQVARIKSLESLWVINAKFLPADLKPFAKHPSLQTLDALFTTFDELGHEEGRLRLLGALSDDERAWIEAATARWPHDPNQLKGYRRVVEGAAITDPALEALTALPKLRTIRLVNTSLSDRGLKALQQLPQLEELHVYLVDGSPATGKLLAGFPKLRHLRETYALGYDILPEVARSPTLEELSIRFAKDSQVDYIVLCRDVKRLNLSNNSLTDDGLLKLASMPQLERLVLSGNETQITQIGVKKFRELKPNCEIVGTEQLSEKPAPDAASTANVQSSRGTLKGRFIYDGEAPKARDLHPDLSKLEKDVPVPRDSNGRPIGTAMWYLDYMKAGIRPKTEDASLLVDKDGGIANIVVWVTSKDIPWTPKDNYELPAMIYVKEGHFTPRIRLLTTGRPLLVENTDPVAFTFATTFQRNNDVNALLPPAADKKPFRIDKLQSEQFPAPFHSTVATWAEGFLFVRDNTYIAVSQPDGTFTIPDLPPGEWQFRAWHERRGYLAHWPKGTFRHTIQPGDNNLGTIKLKPEFFEPREER